MLFGWGGGSVERERKERGWVLGCVVLGEETGGRREERKGGGPLLCKKKGCVRSPSPLSVP